MIARLFRVALGAGVSRTDALPVSTVTDTAWAAGEAGVNGGAFTTSWPQIQYGDLAVTP